MVDKHIYSSYKLCEKKITLHKAPHSEMVRKSICFDETDRAKHIFLMLDEQNRPLQIRETETLNKQEYIIFNAFNNIRINSEECKDNHMPMTVPFPFEEGNGIIEKYNGCAKRIMYITEYFFDCCDNKDNAYEFFLNRILHYVNGDGYIL